MIVRKLALAAAAITLCAADEPPPPPPELAPYVSDGQLAPGDYPWARGRFQDATEQERAEFMAISRWAMHCLDQAKAAMKERLAQAGYSAARLETTPVGPLLCRQAITFPYLPEVTTYAEYAGLLRQSAPIADAYLLAVQLAERFAGARGPELAEQLLARPLGEQLVRSALSWGHGAAADAPPLTPQARAIVTARLAAAMAARDHANTAWLKTVVAEQGWPTISQVGEPAANNAWLLVQHADHDPLFQLEALRLMEPLVAQGEVSSQNFAYLTDRVGLKLAGKQRYGTQFSCVDGQHTPLPLEDEGAVERLRAEAGMETLAQNLARMRDTYGPCRTG